MSSDSANHDYIEKQTPSDTSHDDNIADTVFSFAQDASKIQQRFKSNQGDLIRKKISGYTKIMCASFLGIAGSAVLMFGVSATIGLLGAAISAMGGLASFNSYQQAESYFKQYQGDIDDRAVTHFNDNTHDLRHSDRWNDEARETYQACLWMLSRRKDMTENADRVLIVQQFKQQDARETRRIFKFKNLIPA